MAAKTPVSVLVVIHTPALDVLLLERAVGAGSGFWQSVTGSREGTEALAETAVREVAEETAIACSTAQLIDWRLSNRFEIMPLWRARYAQDISHNVEHVFSLCVAADTPVVVAPEEHRDWRWLPWREAAAACFSWTNRDAILMLGQRAGA